MSPAAPYWWINVKVGLDTSSAAAAPRASTIPLARVVFPAPRLPINNTTPFNSGASFRPSAIVSSSDRVRNVRDCTNPFWQIAQQIGGDHILLGQMPRSDFTGEPMQVHCGGHRSLRILRELAY